VRWPVGRVCSHRPGALPASISNDAERDLGGAVTLGAGADQREAGQLLGNGLQRLRRVLAHRLAVEHGLAQPLRPALGEQFAEHGTQLGGGALPLQRAQHRQRVNAGQKVQLQRVAGLPVVRDLQDRRAAEAAMGDQHRVAESGLAGAGGDRQRHAGQIRASGAAPSPAGFIDYPHRSLPHESPMTAAPTAHRCPP
jgi:hypothetical protein